MRIFNKYAYMGAIALVGAVGFTACSSDDDLTAPQNPTFDGESVKTQFAISIPYAGKGTRLAEDIVQGQETPKFRGMSNIKLIPFNALPGAGTPFTSDAIILDNITNNGLTDGAKFYTDIQVPVGTTHFLFYAEATRETTTDNKVNGAIVVPGEFDNGDLLNGGLDNLDNLEFNLKEINPTQGAINVETFLLGALNGITGVLYNNMTGNENLIVAYNNFVTLKAGSGASVLAAVQRLYDIVKDGTDPSAAYSVAEEIKKYFTPDGSGILSYKTDASGYSKDVPTYPTELGLPAGAAQVKATENNGAAHTFVYNTTDYSAKFGSYAYPASLYYYVNTPVKTDDEAHQTNWNSMGTKNWNEFLNTYYNGTGTSVTAATKSVVLENPVNYAVSRFDVLPVFKSDVTGQVPDQHGVYREIGSNFVLTGILVGQQNPVNYAFEWKNVTDDKVKTIYDASITQTAITETVQTKPFYTLVLQSEDGSQAEKTVNFALEFKNNGEDFYGVNGNIIPKGGTFYLVGNLSNYKEGSRVENYVFEKDHNTVANITIKSLKNAYNTVPDLRKTKLELGLYVDLTWQAGLVGNVTIE